MSVALHHLQQRPLGLGLRGRHLIEPTLAIGRTMAELRGRQPTALRMGSRPVTST